MAFQLHYEWASKQLASHSMDLCYAGSCGLPTSLPALQLALRDTSLAIDELEI